MRRDFQRHRVQLGQRDLVIRERRVAVSRIDQLNGFAAVARSTGERAEVAGKGCRVRDVGDRRWRVGTVTGTLVAAKEEQFVLDDSAAEGAAELVALQRVVRGREEVAGVDIAIAQVIEEIAVKTVRTRLGNHVYGRAWVGAEAR